MFIKRFYTFIKRLIKCPHSEENVWQLAASVRRSSSAALQRCFVVFISNDARCVPLWRQRAGRTEDKLVTWVSGFQDVLDFFSPLIFSIFRKIEKNDFRETFHVGKFNCDYESNHNFLCARQEFTTLIGIIDGRSESVS